jgi:hypothetical protein
MARPDVVLACIYSGIIVSDKLAMRIAAEMDLEWRRVSSTRLYEGRMLQFLPPLDPAHADTQIEARVRARPLKSDVAVCVPYSISRLARAFC